MDSTLKKSGLFPAKLVSQVITLATEKSSLMRMTDQRPIPFNGQKEFIFSFDSEIDIVAESGKKSHGGISIEPITVVPLKVEYGARVTDEFMFAAEEEKIDILRGFVDGYAKKIAKGLDLMAMHGINPRSGEHSTIIGDNHFDSKVTKTIAFNKSNPNTNVESAIRLIHADDREVSALIMGREFSNSLADMTTMDGTNISKFPELGWGAMPETINNIPIDINNTVSHSSNDVAIVGDFANMFQWGYAKEFILDVIEYGDPDSSGRDLKGYNQVYLRAESYIGWAIMDGDSFSRIVKGEDEIQSKNILTEDIEAEQPPVQTASKEVTEKVQVQANNEDNDQEITIEQIKQELDAFGVKYDKNADRETLLNLMMNQSE